MSQENNKYIYDRLIQEKKAIHERITSQNKTIDKLREINNKITERIQQEKKQALKKFQEKKESLKETGKDLKNLKKQKDDIVRIYYTKYAYDRKLGRNVEIIDSVKEVPRSQAKQLKNSVLDNINKMEQKGKGNNSFFKQKEQHHTR